VRPALELTKAASVDLRNIGEWLRQAGAGRSAKRRLGHILAAVERLPDFPRRGHAIGAGPIRALAIERHRILYRIVNSRKTTDAGQRETIYILRILGPGQTS
jgi:plasmid stabilization system protein ParE